MTFSKKSARVARVMAVKVVAMGRTKTVMVGDKVTMGQEVAVN